MIEQQEIYYAYTGNGVVTTFAYGCRIFEASDLVVKVAGAIQALGVHYNISGVDAVGGGEVTFVSGSIPTGLVELERVLDYTRLTGYVQNGDFRPSTVDRDQDYQTALLQQMELHRRYFMRLPVGSTADIELPAVTPKGLLAWNPAGTAIEYLLTAPPYVSTTVSASAYGSDLSAAIAAIGSANMTLVVDSPITVNDDVAIHHNTTLVVQKPGVILVAVGKKLNGLNSTYVDWFGAVGNGITDDTKAIQTAIDALDSGGIVYFSKAFYLVSSEIKIENSGITLQGAGKANSIIVSSDSGHWTIVLKNGSDYTTIRDIWIKGAAIDETTSQYGVGYADAATDVSSFVTIENCRFSHGNCGIVTGSGKYWRILNNTFDTLVGTIAGRGYGVLAAETSSHIIINSNHFIGSPGHGRHAAYLTVGCSYSVISNNLVDDFAECAFVSRATDTQPGVTGNIIRDNTINAGGTVTTAESAAVLIGGNASYCAVINNTIIGFKNDGISLNYQGYGALCKNNTISGNMLMGMYLSGITVIGAKNSAVLGNYVYNSSQNAEGVSRGILITSSGSAGTEVCDGTKVTGNISMGSSQRVAFGINSAAPIATNTTVSGNIFYAGATPGRAVELNEVAGAIVSYINNGTDSTYAYGGSDITRHLSQSAALNFASIPAHTTAELTIGIVGVDIIKWSTTVTPEGIPESGLVWNSYVSAVNVVTIRVVNVTTAAIDPASRTYRIDCFRHN